MLIVSGKEKRELEAIEAERDELRVRVAQLEKACHIGKAELRRLRGNLEAMTQDRDHWRTIVGKLERDLEQSNVALAELREVVRIATAYLTCDLDDGDDS